MVQWVQEENGQTKAGIARRAAPPRGPLRLVAGGGPLALRASMISTRTGTGTRDPDHRRQHRPETGADRGWHRQHPRFDHRKPTDGPASDLDRVRQRAVGQGARGQITANDAQAAWAAIAATPIRALDAESLVGDALVTADAAFAAKVAGRRRYAGAVRLL